MLVDAYPWSAKLVVHVSQNTAEKARARKVELSLALLVHNNPLPQGALHSLFGPHLELFPEQVWRTLGHQSQTVARKIH